MKKSDILQAAKWRTAIRKFDPNKKISNEDFEFLLEIARLSPTSNGVEPWNIIVVQNHDLRNRLAKVAPGGAYQLDSASHVVIFTTKKAAELKPNSSFIKHMSIDVHGYPASKFALWKQTYRFFLSSMLGILKDDALLEAHAQRQAYIVLGNIMLAAAEMGIDSSPAEGFYPDKFDEILSKAGALNKDTDQSIVMVSFGYRSSGDGKAKSRLTQKLAGLVNDNERGHRTRRPMDEIVKFV
jgi:nitroreductase